MPLFLEKRDRWGHGMAFWVIGAAAFVLPFVFWSVSRIDMHNDVAGWLPRDDPQARLLEWYQGHFPTEDRMLLTWEGASLTDPRIAEFVDELEGIESDSGEREGGSPYVKGIAEPSELLIRMMENGVPFEQAMVNVTGLLMGSGPLHIRLTDVGRARGDYFHQEILDLAQKKYGLEARFVSQTMPLPDTSHLSLDDADDEAEWAYQDAVTDYLQTQPLHDLQLVWPGMHLNNKRNEEFRTALSGLQAGDVSVGTAGEACVAETWFIPGTVAALSVTLSEAGSADRDEAIAAVVSAAEAAGIPEAAMHMGGRPVAGEALNQSVKHAGWNRAYPVWDLPHRSPILLSFVAGTIFTILMLRSLRLSILVQGVSFLTALSAVAIVPLTGGSMNMVLVVMPTLLVVLTTSAAIHVCNYWRRSGRTKSVAAVLDAIRSAWLPCFLASLTTAVGLASLGTSTLVPVRDFGVYSAVGCLISFAAVMYLLPSFMLYWQRVPEQSEDEAGGFWRHLGQGLCRYRHLVLAGSAVLTIGAAWGLQQFRTETKVIRYFPESSDLVQDYYYLEDNLAGIISVDTIVRFDQQAQKDLSFTERLELVGEIQQDLRNHPEISGVLSLASFLHVEPVEGGGAAARLRRNLRDRRIREALEDSAESAGRLKSILVEADKAGHWYEEGDQKLNQKGDQLWRITAQASIMSDYDYQQLTSELDEIARQRLALVGSPGTGHVVTGLIPIFLRTQQAVLESLIRSFGLAFVLIGFVMIILLRNPVAGVLTMVPNIMPVVLVFGGLSWAQLRVDMGTMITASVALGIAVDGTLHLVSWFRRLIADGVSRNEATVAALEHCGPAMWQTSAAVGFGMLCLLPAELLLISRFGWMMAALIFAALFADVIVLPALLAGPLGSLLERSTPRVATSDKSADAVTDGRDSDESIPIPGRVASSNAHAMRPHLRSRFGSSLRLQGNMDNG